jgi:hypothetical protein
MKKIKYTMLLVIIAMTAVQSQEEATKKIQEVDASNPTNLYTQVNALFEYTSLKDGTNLYGVRANVQYSFDSNNLVLAEVPLLYNDATDAFGLSDVRLRYFTVVKRVMTPEKFSVIAPFVDVTLPTGKYEDGLGSSSFVLSAGSVYGFSASKKVQLFPGLSVVHVTKPQTDLIPEKLKFSSTGFLFQANVSISFTKSWFFFVNPVITMLNTSGEWNEAWSGEFNLNHMIIPNKLKANVGYYPNFTNEANTFRLGATFFL